MKREMRWAFFGALLGVLVAIAPSCSSTKPCAQSCANGCCNAKGVCITPVGDTACGASGSTCVECSATEACTNGACKGTGGGSGGGDGGNNDGGNTDGGGQDAGPTKCVIDEDCVSLHVGATCNVLTNTCTVGRGCYDDTNCQIDDSNDPCYRYGIQCRCDLTDKPDAGSAFNYNGTCRRRLAACSECTTDVQCGVGVIFGPQEGIGEGRCKQLPGDSSGKRYCLYQRVGQCSCGTIDDGTGYCRPQSNSCQQVGCNLDKDCPSGSVCTVNQPDAGAGSCGGTCVPRCRWDFVHKTLVAPGCPTGQSCWVDSANLDPTSIYYGSGRCRPPCASNADCANSAANPFGGANLKCAGEQQTGGGLSDKRCRANGDCMDNEECPQLPNNQPYLGYCDRAAFACRQDCRTGNDPVTGQNYADCRQPYACARDGGSNICRLLSCVEQGGAGIACSRTHYCYGDDKNGDTMVDPGPPPSERDPAGCYLAPMPPFCTKCMSDTDCLNPQLPAWMSGVNACSNGSKSPSCSPLKPKCMQISMQDAICAPSTWNDNTLVGLVRKSQLGCPAGYQVTPVRPKISQSQDDYCDSDNDCTPGTNDAGRCAYDYSAPLGDGGFPKACLCTAGTGTGQCPNVDGGRYSECRSGVAGQTTYCVETVVCLTTPGVAYKDAGAPEWGCGF